MSRNPAALDPEQQRSLDNLYSAAADLGQSGSPVPCTRSNWAAWTADDPESQAFAAAHCGGCPLLSMCRAHIDRWPEPAGVWAGKLPSERKSKK